MRFEERKVLINSFILSNFNYCPFFWSISSGKSLNKVKNLQKQGLRFLYNDCNNSYEELFKKSGNSTLNILNYHSFCTEIFKTLNIINPSFIKDIFHLRMPNRSTREKYKTESRNSKAESSKIWNKKFEIPWTKGFGTLCHTK